LVSLWIIEGLELVAPLEVVDTACPMGDKAFYNGYSVKRLR